MRLTILLLAFAIIPGTMQAQDESAVSGAAPAAGDSASESDQVQIKRVGLLLASPTDDPAVHAKIRGGTKIVLAAAYEWDYGVRLFSAEKWREQKYEWKDFVIQAAKEADRLVEATEPVIYRDVRGVIDYAELTSDDPFLSSVLLSKRLIPKFKRDLGSRIYAIVVDRYRIYLFPADGGKLDRYGAALADVYKETERPVSLEIILIDENGVQVIGEIGQ